MIGFIFIGIPIICIVALILLAVCGDEWFGHGAPRGKGTYVYIHDEEGEIVDSFVDKSGRYDDYLDDDEDDFPGGIRMDDGSIMTDDDDYLEEFGEDGL